MEAEDCWPKPHTSPKHTHWETVPAPLLYSSSPSPPSICTVLAKQIHEFCLWISLAGRLTKSQNNSQINSVIINSSTVKNEIIIFFNFKRYMLILSRWEKYQWVQRGKVTIIQPIRNILLTFESPFFPSLICLSLSLTSSFPSPLSCPHTCVPCICTI